MLLLSDTALNDFYQRRTIYFWNTEHTALVPDLRYMPRSVPHRAAADDDHELAGQRPGALADDRVRALPQGTTRPENVPGDQQRQAADHAQRQRRATGRRRALDRLRRQLQWSLRPLCPRTLELKIGHQDPVRYTDTDYLSSNPAYRLADDPGAVRDLQRGDPPAAPLAARRRPGAGAQGRPTTRASRRPRSAPPATHSTRAVVTGAAAGSQRLRVASAADRRAGRPQAGSPACPARSGRPVWAVTADGDPDGAVGLITANGRLYSFAADGAGAGRSSGRAARPDHRGVGRAGRAPGGAGGRRPALPRGAQHRPATGSTLSTPEQLRRRPCSAVAAVAWSSEDLAGGGRRARRRPSRRSWTCRSTARCRTTGCRTSATKPVTYLTAYPANPSTGRDRPPVVTYMAGGSAWDALVRARADRASSDLAGAAGDPPAGRRRPRRSSSTETRLTLALLGDLADLVLPAACAGCGAERVPLRVRRAAPTARPAGGAAAVPDRAGARRRPGCRRCVAVGAVRGPLRGACSPTRNAAGTGWPGRWARCWPRRSRRSPATGRAGRSWCRSRRPRRRPGSGTATTWLRLAAHAVRRLRAAGWEAERGPAAAGAAASRLRVTGRVRTGRGG